MLKLLGYKGLSMRDLKPYLDGEKTGRVVGITFDDGYQNNVRNALPILKKHGFTATCYGVSSMIGGKNIWDLGKVAEKPLMTLRDWKTWLAVGMDVGSHTKTHANLTELDDNEVRAQVWQSKTELEQALDCEVRHFCYPYGHFRHEHMVMVREAGYHSATTTHRGRVNSGDDAYTLKRVLIARATNPLLFFLKIATRYEDKRGN
jgi:peptidoglycan/xylan/chitin deacetylase (PgdA/CDA1 family)